MLSEFFFLKPTKYTSQLLKLHEQGIRLIRLSDIHREQGQDELLEEMYHGLYKESFPQHELVDIKRLRWLLQHKKLEISLLKDKDDIHSLVISSFYPESHTGVFEYVVTKIKGTGRFLYETRKQDLVLLAKQNHSHIKLMIGEASIPHLANTEKEAMNPYDRIYLQTVKLGGMICAVDYVNKPHPQNKIYGNRSYLLLLAYPSPDGKIPTSQVIQSFIKERYRESSTIEQLENTEFTTMMEQLLNLNSNPSSEVIDTWHQTESRRFVHSNRP